MFTLLALLLTAEPLGVCIELKLAGTCMPVQADAADGKKFCSLMGYPWSAEPCPPGELGQCLCVDNDKKPFVKHMYQGHNYPDISIAKDACAMGDCKWVPAPKPKAPPAKKKP